MANPTPNEVNADTATAADEMQADMTEVPDIHKMKRAELEAYAVEQGIADAASYPNMEALIEALEAALEPSSAGGGDDPGLDADEAEPFAFPSTSGTADVGRSWAAPEASATYTVLKAFTLDDGRTVMPGETFVFEGHWPARRAKQMVEQQYLRPND